jgi:hypothetical protein
MDDRCRILASHESLYAQADAVTDTAARSRETKPLPKEP